MNYIQMGMENRITDLKRKLAARRGSMAFRDNVPALEAEIDRLETLLADATAQQSQET